MGLRSFILKRAIYSFFLILVVISLNFLIFEIMPGNPIDSFIMPGKISPQIEQALIARFGLDKPPLTRYFIYVKNLLTGDLGVSFVSMRPVAADIGGRLVNTLLLMGTSTIFAIILGVVLGVIAAQRRGGKFDSGSVFVSLTTYSLPSFWMGMILLLVFGAYLKWFPIAGAVPSQWYDITVFKNGPPKWPQDWSIIIGGRLQCLFLPALTLTLFSYGGYLLLTRAVMLDTLTEDYIVTARAKGLKERTVLFKHALKNASLPLITNIALSFGFLISGAIITEQVFTYQGMGWWIWNSIVYLDYPALGGIFYIIALMVIAANFISDLLYGLVDPRIKYG